MPLPINITRVITCRSPQKQLNYSSKKLITLKAICDITGMTDKWFYQHIKDGRTWTGCESNPNWMGERGSDEYKENEKCFLIKLDGSTEYKREKKARVRGWVSACYAGTKRPLMVEAALGRLCLLHAARQNAF